MGIMLGTSFLFPKKIIMTFEINKKRYMSVVSIFAGILS